MKAIRTLKLAAGWSAAITLILSLSYCSEWPKYRFEKTAREVGRSLPGSRLISSMKSGDLASPVSWFWPATTTLNFASPAPLIRDRYYTFSMIYDEKLSPIVFLVDADCETRTLRFYDLDEPETAFPAIDLFGQPVVAPNGKTYRKMKSTVPSPPEWIHAFCDTKWSKEMAAVAAYQSRH